MKTAAIFCAVLGLSLAKPNGYYHQAYNYQTSSASYKNHELQRKNDDRGFYSQEGDLEGRLRPKVNSHAEHSEYVNPRMQQGFDRSTSYGQLYAQNHFRPGDPGFNPEMQPGGGGGGYGYVGQQQAIHSNLRQVTMGLQEEMARELQRAVYEHYRRSSAYSNTLTQSQIQADMRALEEEMRRNVTIRLEEALKSHYGNQGIRGGYYYTIQNGRLQPTANFHTQELAELQRQMEANLMRELEQQVQTYYHTTVNTEVHTQRNTYRKVNGNYPAPIQQRPPVYHPYPPQQINIPVHIPDSITTVATRVQTDLNEHLNHILEETQKRYFTTGNYHNQAAYNYDSILAQLVEELRANITIQFDDQIKRTYGYNNYAASKYSLEDIENLRRQIETNLVTKLTRDFNRQREKFFQNYAASTQIFDRRPIPPNHVYYPEPSLHYQGAIQRQDNLEAIQRQGNLEAIQRQGDLAAIHRQGDIAAIQRQMQESLSRQLQEALMRQSYRQAHMYQGGGTFNPQANYQATLDQLTAELNRNLTRQMEQFYHSENYQGAQLANMRSQLQHDLQRQLQQGLQQSYSRYSSWSSSSSSHNANYRPVRGFDPNLYRTYGGSDPMPGEDCMMGDDPSAYQQQTQDDPDQTQQTQTEDDDGLTQQVETNDDLIQAVQDDDDLTQQVQTHDEPTQQVQTHDALNQQQDIIYDDLILQDQDQDLTQQVQTHDDLTQQVQTHDDLTQQDQTNDDLTQQVQTQDDLTQQVQTLDNLTQQDQTHGDLTQQVQTQDDLTQQVQTHDDLTQQVQTQDDLTQQVQTQDDLTQQVQTQQTPNVAPYQPRQVPAYTPYRPPPRFDNYEPRTTYYTHSNPHRSQYRYYSRTPTYTSSYVWVPQRGYVQQQVQQYERYNAPFRTTPQQPPSYPSQRGQQPNQYRSYPNPPPVPVQLRQETQNVGQEQQTELLGQNTYDSGLTQQMQDPGFGSQTQLVQQTEDIDLAKLQQSQQQLGQQTEEIDLAKLQQPQNQLRQQTQDLTLGQQQQQFIEVGNPKSHDVLTQYIEREPIALPQQTQYQSHIDRKPIYLNRQTQEIRNPGLPRTYPQQTQNDLTQQIQDPGFGGSQQPQPQFGQQTYLGQTEDLQLGQQTQDLPFGQQTQDLQLGQQTQDLQFGQQTPNLPFGQQTQDLQLGQQTQDLPFGQQTQDLQLGQQTQDLPFGQQTQDLQYPQSQDLTQQTQDLELGQQVQDLHFQQFQNQQIRDNKFGQSQDLTQQTQDLELGQQTQDLQFQQFPSQNNNFGDFQQSQDLTQQTQDVQPNQQYTRWKPRSRNQLTEPVDSSQRDLSQQTQEDDFAKLTQQDLTQQTQEDDFAKLTQQDLTQQTEDDDFAKLTQQQAQILTQQQTEDVEQPIEPESSPNKIAKDEPYQQLNQQTEDETSTDLNLIQQTDDKQRLEEAQRESQMLIDSLKNQQQQQPNGTMEYQPQPVYGEIDGQPVQVGTTRQRWQENPVYQNPDGTTGQVLSGRSLINQPNQINYATEEEQNTETVSDIEPIEPQIANQIKQLEPVPGVEADPEITTKKPGFWSRLGTSIKNKAVEYKERIG